jgi:hypothetical protein
MKKLSRIGLTKKEWIEFITEAMRLVNIEVKIKFTPEGIYIGEWALIGFGEETIKGIEDCIQRGYILTTFTSAYSYHSGYDTIDNEHGFFRTPFDVINKLCRMALEDRLFSVYEAVTYQRQKAEEERAYKELEEYYAKQLEEEQMNDDEDYFERHNKQAMKGL